MVQKVRVAEAYTTIINEMCSIYWLPLNFKKFGSIAICSLLPLCKKINDHKITAIS